MSARVPDPHPPTVTLLWTAGILAASLAGYVGLLPVAVLEGTPALRPLAAACVLHHPAVALGVLIALLTAGKEVEARLGPAPYALLLGAGVAASLAAGAILPVAAPAIPPGAPGAALAAVAAFAVLSPRAGVPMYLPGDRDRQARSSVALVLSGGVAVIGAFCGHRLVPWAPAWLHALLYVLVVGALFHEHVARTKARRQGDPVRAGDGFWLTVQAWLLLPLLLALYVGLGALGLGEGPATILAATTAGAGLALACSLAGLVEGTYEEPTLAEVLGLRPFPRKQEWRRTGRLPWDPTLPPPG
jgi:hypothetical protein